MLPGGETCTSCVFWTFAPFASNSSVRLGLCQRHAPSSAIVDGKLRTRWPLTKDDDWCGDHAIYEQQDGGDNEQAT
jgi:hypothetical protein